MSLSSGTRFGPYELTVLLGTGGMGQVYEARDTRLGRDVAIKLLPVDSDVTPEARQRLAREARAVAALQHPNICTLFDVGETPDGHAYLVMERLHGETVRERISRGTIPADEVIDLAVSLADALETAHAAGIVHRDLKPANIMLTPRGPKILDFGVARTPAAVPDAVTATGLVTEPGHRIGTVAYMSPEQLRGETVDARSDLFSFGLVLHEMMTCRRAFTGASATTVPATLDAVVSKALEQDRSVRYQHAAELRGDLLRIKRDLASTAAAVVPPATARRTTLSWAFALTVGVVATAAYVFSRPATAAKLSDTDTIVLSDFANSTGDPVFDDTLRQALSVQLQQSPFLSLVPDTRIRQTLRLMGQSADVRLTPVLAQEICQRSGATAVLDGSIAPLGSQLVIGLRAGHCETGEILDQQQAQVARKEDVLTRAEHHGDRVSHPCGRVARHRRAVLEAARRGHDPIARRAQSVQRSESAQYVARQRRRRGAVVSTGSRSRSAVCNGSRRTWPGLRHHG